MSRNKHISYTAAAGWMDISVPPDMSEEFKKLVQRATSTWQDMSPDMRDFADRVLGVDKIMGQNMKEGHSSNINSPREFSVHGIKFIEDKTLAPTEVGTKAQQSNIAMLRGITWDCFWATGCVNSNTCKKLNKCDAVAIFKKVSPVVIPVPPCDGHPETCNCPKHCR